MSQPLFSAVTSGGASLGTQSALVEARELVLAGQKLQLPPPRILSAEDLDRFEQDLQTQRKNLVAQHLKKAENQPSLAHSVLAIIKSAATNRGRSGFGDPAITAGLLNQIQEQLKSQATLILVLPMGGGKVANPIKTGSEYLPDASEWIAHIHLAALAQAIEQLYPPGAAVVTIPDAPLHATDIGFPMPELRAHDHTLRQDLFDLGIADHVAIAPTIDLLPAAWPHFARQKADQLTEQATHDPKFQASQAARVRSLQYSVNTAIFGWSYERSVLAASAVNGDPAQEPSPDSRLLRSYTHSIVSTYDAVNAGIREMDLASRAARAHSGHSCHLRLTVHAKPGEPRPLLSQNGPRSRPALIPMHGQALRYPFKGGMRFATIFDVEARIHGYVPVLHPTSGRFLFFEPEAE